MRPFDELHPSIDLNHWQPLYKKKYGEWPRLDVCCTLSDGSDHPECVKDVETDRAYFILFVDEQMVTMLEEQSNETN